MHDQHFLVDLRDVFLAAGQRIDPALPGRRKHLRITFMKARPDAGLITQSRKIIIDQAAIIGEHIHDASHILE